MDKLHDLSDRLNNMSVKEVIKEIKTYLVNPNTFIPSFIHWMNHFGLTDEIPRHLQDRLLIPTINGHVLSIVTIREIAYLHKTDLFQLDRVYKTLLMCASISILEPIS